MNESKNNNRILSYGTYLALWIVLNALAAFTAAFSGMNFSNYNVLFMLSVVVIMAYVIVIYFMYVKYDSLFFKLFMAVTTVILVAVFAIILFGYNL